MVSSSSTAPPRCSTQRWRDWAWPMCRRTWRSLIWTEAISRGCSRTGALRIRATTSTTRAAASPRRHLPCWSMRCATGVEAPARASYARGVRRKLGWPMGFEPTTTGITRDRITKLFIPSQRGEIARDGVAFALGQHLHEFRHVEVVGSLLGGKGAHCRGEVFITEPGQPRRRHAALEVRLMTSLALGDAFRRQRRLCGRPPRRPRLGSEIGRDLAQVALGQILGDGCHDRARALAVPEIAHLLHEVTLLLAPDDRDGLRIGRSALVAMACRTQLRFRLDLIRGMHWRDGGRKADPHSENHRKEARVHWLSLHP